MLLQSHLGEIHLLAAMPAAWKEGKVIGLKARGNFTVSINWKNQRLTSAVITSNSGGVCKVRTSNAVVVKELGIKSKKEGDGWVLSFNSTKGRRYNLLAL